MKADSIRHNFRSTNPSVREPCVLVVNWDAVVHNLARLLYAAGETPDPDTLQEAAQGRQSDRSSAGPPGPEMDERALLQALRALDPRMLAAVHDQFYAQVYRFAAYRTGNPKIAEDLAAEVFLRLIEALHRGQGPRKTLRGWLMGTASNLVSDYYRLNYKVRHEVLSEDLPANHLDPAALTEIHEREDAVRESLKKLTVEQQNVLAFRFGAGFSVTETAEAMDKNVNAIKQLQFRAIAALRRHLERQQL